MVMMMMRPLESKQFSHVATLSCSYYEYIANFAVVAGSYGFAFLTDSDDDDDEEKSGKNQPAWLKFIYKSLDFGSGKERGARN